MCPRDGSKTRSDDGRKKGGGGQRRGAGWGTLSDRRVAAGTLKRYKNEVGKFLQWVVMSKLQLPTNIWELDDLLCIFVEELWASGESVSLAEGCISGMHHFIPQLALRTPGPQEAD